MLEIAENFVCLCIMMLTNELFYLKIMLTKEFYQSAFKYVNGIKFHLSNIIKVCYSQYLSLNLCHL